MVRTTRAWAALAAGMATSSAFHCRCAVATRWPQVWCVRGHWHHHTVVVHKEVHVGHGGYDCHAGASNWMQGWWLGTAR